MNYFYIDKDGNKVIEGRYLKAQRFSQGLAFVTTDRHEGVFIDKNGTVVIGPGGYGASPFSEGLSAFSGGGIRGYMDLTGRIAIKTDFDRVYDFSEGVALGVRDDRTFLIDRSGKILLSFDGEKTFENCGGYPKFSGGMIAFRDTRTDLCGYIDQRGKLAIAPQFECAAPFSEGLARVSVIRDRTEFVGFVTLTGEWAIQPTFDVDHDFEICSTDFSDGVASLIDRTSDDSFVYINRAGKVVIAPGFNRAEAFKDGLAPAFDSKSLKWGYIDRSGKPKIPFRFETASEFSEGLAAVAIVTDE